MLTVNILLIVCLLLAIWCDLYRIMQYIAMNRALRRKNKVNEENFKKIVSNIIQKRLEQGVSPEEIANELHDALMNIWLVK